jgi:hypothetical protein
VLVVCVVVMSEMVAITECFSNRREATFRQQKVRVSYPWGEVPAPWPQLFMMPCGATIFNHTGIATGPL